MNTKTIRWTVRGVTPVTLDMIHEVAAASEITFGEALNEAVKTWYDGLEDESDEEDIDISDFNGTALTGPRRFWIPGEVEFEDITPVG